MTTLKRFLCELSDKAYDSNRFQSTVIHAEQLGSGCARSVYKMEFEGREIAVKFVWDNLWIDNNRREFRYYRNMPKPVQDLMAEVLGISTCGRVIAFELVPHTLLSSPRYRGNTARHGRGWNQKLKDILKAHGFSWDEVYNLTSDNHYNNIGVRENGDIVWIDYACASDE